MISYYNYQIHIPIRLRFCIRFHFGFIFGLFSGFPRAFRAL